MSDDALDTVLERIDEMIEVGEIEEAEGALREALDQHGRLGALLVLQAEIAVEAEDYDGAIAAANQALEELEGEELGRALAAKGYAYYYLDKLDRSRDAFNAAVKSSPTLMTAIVGRAMTHEDLGYFTAALLDLDRAIQIDDQEAQPWAIRGSIYLRMGQVEEAKTDLTYAVESDPDDEASRLNLARIHALEGDKNRAMELLEPLCDDGWDADFVAPALLLRSQLSLALGSYEPGLEDAENAIALIDDLPWGYLQAAACILTGQADPGEAVAYLKRAEDTVDDLRDIPDIYALYASAYEQLGKNDKAEEWREAAEGTPRLPGYVYGPTLNPAQNIPINPNKPIDVRRLLDDLFGEARLAPEGFEEQLREILEQIPQIAQQNPGAEQLVIELPEAEGMVGGQRQLVIKMNQEQAGQ